MQVEITTHRDVEQGPPGPGSVAPLGPKRTPNCVLFADRLRRLRWQVGNNTYRKFMRLSSADDRDVGMKKLEWELLQATNRNRDGSRATQANRADILSLCARQLDELGYKQLCAQGLGQRHLRALVKHWTTDGLAAGTMKNRLAALRWICEKLGKSGVAGITNDELGIARRVYVARESRATDLPRSGQLERVDSQHIRYSLQLSRLFGLRVEESMKFIVSAADCGDRIALTASWCKGGRAREVPVRTPEQRQLLDDIRRFVGSGSLIPRELTYKQHRNNFYRQLKKADISRAHGLRHLYAQKRYLELTGELPPAVRNSLAAGISCPVPELPMGFNSPRFDDKTARLRISEELGHSREQITTVYLGR